jgi:hypothetical protein
MEEMNLAVKIVLLLTPIVCALLFGAYYHFKIVNPRITNNYQNFLRTRNRDRILKYVLILIGLLIGVLIDCFILGEFDSFLGLTSRVM